MPFVSDNMKRFLLILLSLALPIHAATKTCTFTAADGTELSTYSASGELAWTEASTMTTGNIIISDANRARTDTTATSWYYANNFTAATYNYDVEANITFVSVPTSNQAYIGIAGRATSTSGQSGYIARIDRDSGVWEIHLDRAGGSALIEAPITTPTAGSTYALKLEMRDNVVRAYWNGALALTYPINVASANYLTGVGNPAIYMDMNSGSLTNSTGIHLDNFTVTDAPAINTTGTQTPAASDFWFNCRDGTSSGTYVPEQSAFAELRFTTNAQKMIVTGTTNASSHRFQLWIDGVQTSGADYSVLQFSGTGSQTFTTYFFSAPGTVKEIRIQGYSAAYSSGTLSRSRIQTVELQDYYNTPTYTLIPPERPELLIYGDSITVGASAAAPASNAIAVKLRRLYGRKVAEDGWSGRALSQDGFTAGERTTLAGILTRQQPYRIWMQVATNDYGAVAAWNATDFGVAYADLIDKIHAIDPTIMIWCQSPTQRISPFNESANAFGNTTQDYRNVIASVAAARPTYCTYVNGAGGRIVADMHWSDGLHASAHGQQNYADFINATVWGTRINSAAAGSLKISTAAGSLKLK